MELRPVAGYRPTKPELAVFVSGITSMGLEILAVRIVAPQFGSHIYTVGGILTVFLIALSLGYWQGGKRAGGASNREMSWIMLATAVYVAVVIYASDLLLTYTSTLALPPRYASLPAVILLFGPPTYLLGFISPYAAELSHKQGTGEASGHVYALGTIGSIVGAAATTFVLIPALSVDAIGLLFGGALVGTAVALLAPDLTRRSAVSSVLVVLLLVGAAGATPVDVDYRGDVVSETQTPHQQLEIVDDGTERTMYLDGARHSAMDLEDPERHVFTYTKYFHLPMLMADDPDDVDRVLFVGGGGYTGPQDFADRYDAHVDVVEIDPEVTAAAEAYFGLEPDREDISIYEADGRQFLEGTNDTYDVIVLDAYKQDQVPFHLTTVEFMELATERLADDGVLHANVISSPSGPAAEFYHAQHRTMASVFPDTYSFRTADSSAVQNIQVVATNEPTGFSDADLAERNDARDLGVDLEGAIDNRMADPDTEDAPVLRDDRGEVDSLLDPMLGQRYVIEETDGEPYDDATETAVIGEERS
ncbi:spermidine synthase [Natrarchaeobaculum sulfurireducens]|uniref:Spermidine synthase n=1 Tax=Natrarchaeobaculum sulfurireducens TaxID=2044521 RepID=A0A346PCR1_9EURY|nr:fused MFS/spermidine synthase [Natrarchaeobaculum sulfurireducens]AXR77306.1 Spermidine synthase [Natrarchaeobaculum sulfurireducens]AXR82731.1 Spermidine synthase [Natrarchaeobaculum sulfurireducens]